MDSCVVKYRNNGFTLISATNQQCVIPFPPNEGKKVEEKYLLKYFGTQFFDPINICVY